MIHNLEIMSRIDVSTMVFNINLKIDERLHHKKQNKTEKIKSHYIRYMRNTTKEPSRANINTLSKTPANKQLNSNNHLSIMNRTFTYHNEKLDNDLKSIYKDRRKKQLLNSTHEEKPSNNANVIQPIDRLLSSSNYKEYEKMKLQKKYEKMVDLKKSIANPISANSNKRRKLDSIIAGRNK